MDALESQGVSTESTAWMDFSASNTGNARVCNAGKQYAQCSWWCAAESSSGVRPSGSSM